MKKTKNTKKINIKKRKKINLLNMKKKEINDFLIKIGEKPFRTQQIMKWIYNYYCDDFNLMLNINTKLRNKLNNIAVIRYPEIKKKKISKDGTIKWSFQIENQEIETVYIPNKKTSTICISSQLGCPLKCNFCLTGQQGFDRNLKVFEIIGQIWSIAKKIYLSKKFTYKPITNVVIMGMGEPLLNFKNITNAINIMLDKQGFNFSKRKITLSTSGISPMIKKLASKTDIKLAISLHASNNYLRNKIMPINKKYNIENVLKNAKYFLKKTKANNKKITIEYIMLNGINDKTKHAYQLIKYLKNLPSKINLIPLNTFVNSKYNTSCKKRIISFSKILIQNGFVTTIRKTRGQDIQAACGQLSGKIINKKKETNIINNIL